MSRFSPQLDKEGNNQAYDTHRSRWQERRRFGCSIRHVGNSFIGERGTNIEERRTLYRIQVHTVQLGEELLIISFLFFYYLRNNSVPGISQGNLRTATNSVTLTLILRILLLALDH